MERDSTQKKSISNNVVVSVPSHILSRRGRAYFPGFQSRKGTMSNQAPVHVGAPCRVALIVQGKRREPPRSWESGAGNLEMGTWSRAQKKVSFLH